MENSIRILFALRVGLRLHAVGAVAEGLVDAFA